MDSIVESSLISVLVEALETETVVATYAAHLISVVLGSALSVTYPPIDAIKKTFAPTPSYVVPFVIDPTFTASVLDEVIVDDPGRVDDVEMVRYL